jgi:predicted O-linked N-acetylglucosamine transferase (SPINDLY family)
MNKHNDIASLHTLGLKALQDNRLKQAMTYFKEIISMDACHYPALVNLGTAYKKQGEYVQAMSYYHQALAIQSDPEIHFNLGQGYIKLKQTKLALKHFLVAINLGGKFPELLFNAAVCCEELNRLKKAAMLYQQILTDHPNYIPAVTNLAKLSQDTWDWPTVNRLKPSMETPYANLLRFDDPLKNLAVAKSHAQKIASSIPYCFSHNSYLLSHNSNILNIAYLSPDIGEHVISYHTYPLFELHDRKQFKVFTYSYGPKNDSPYYTRIKQSSYVFRDCYNISSQEIAQQIYDDNIDILVDLSGHTGTSRFEIMAYRPAPIQVHYLGFPGSTGADFIDFFLTDNVVTPPAYQPYFSEKLIFLPNCCQINSPLTIHPHRYTRRQMGLPTKGFVFCSFNQSRKITPEDMSLWVKLLQDIQNSVLWLIESNSIATKNIRDFVASKHVDPKRLVFAPFIEYDQHLDRLALADLALDPTRYNGGATTSDALLAGIPVITKTGNRYVSRMSTSMLTCLGLDECITNSLDEYCQLALDLATHPQKLADIKSKIVLLKSSSTLFKPKIFVKNLESTYQSMWQRYLS